MIAGRYCLPMLWRGLIVIPVVIGLSGCVTTDELFAEYERDFCPVPEQNAPVVIEKVVEKEVLRDRLIVKEVPASSTQLPWEPAVYFDSDDTSINSQASVILDKNLRFLQRFPAYRVSIRGFTDHHATADYNRRLSKQRTDTVIEFFKQRAIDETRFVVHAHGESVALSSTASPIADEISRRVEMILLDEYGRPAVTYQNFAVETGD